ncbi:MAG: DUF58 domain-containing protein [Legionellaceae bacterium]|nr:DUF58 domain-containing protein [Legionellaceae bacterium]
MKASSEAGLIATIDELIALKELARGSMRSLRHKADHVGGYTTPLRGRGMDFSEVRHYQAGDDIRHMEWRVTARTGRAHVKLFEEERERPVVILTDFNPSMFFGTRGALKSVTAARVSALLAWLGMLQGDRIGGLHFSAQQHHEWMPRSRHLGIMPLLASLASYSQKLPASTPNTMTARPLSDAFKRLRSVVRPGSLLLLVSDFYALDEASLSHASRLHLHADMMVYHIQDYLECFPPPPGNYVFTNGVAQETLGLHDKALRERYQATCDQRAEKVRHWCKDLHIPYSAVRGDHDLAEVIQMHFGRRHA